jgi:hypothetical protein
MTARRYQHCFTTTGRFTKSTQSRLERSLIRALLSRGGATLPLRAAVRAATGELSAEGLSDTAVLDTLGALVEETGRGCGVDTMSLLSGEPRWMPVRTQVLETAQSELALRMTLQPGESESRSEVRSEEAVR